MRRLVFSRPWLCAFWLIAATATAIAEAAENPSVSSARDTLFRQVFKHAPPPVPIDSYVVVVVDGAVRRKMRTVLSEDGQQVQLEGKDLILLLSPFLRPDLLGQLEQRIDSRGLLDRAALEAARLAADFNLRTFEYSLTLDPATRIPAVVNLTPPLPDPQMAQALRPAALSAFLNFNVKGVERRTSAASTSLLSRETAVAVDGAVNLKGLVLEGSAFGQAGRPDSWRRGDLRLVYDLPRQALRFLAGDLPYTVTGYQTSPAAGGIGLTKDYALRPHVPTYWTGDFAFKLDRPAEVKLFSNDSLVSTLQLPAGVHDLRRFTPVVGQNDVDIVIEDSAGQRQVLHYYFIHDPGLLDKGLSLYSWHGGFARESNGNAYQYNTDRPVFSGSYLRGVSAATTLGGYAEAQHERSLLGVQTLRALPAGTLLLDTATSRSREGRWDGAAKIALTMNAGRHRPAAYLAVEYLGNRFNSSGALPYWPRDALNFQASMAAPLAAGLTARLSANYYSARGLETRERYGAAATLLQRWSRYVIASFSLRHGRTADSATDTEALFGVRVNFTHSTGSYHFAKEPERDGMNAQWSSPRRNNVSTPYGFASVRTAPDLREYRGGGGYWGNQGMAEASYHRRVAAGSEREEVALRLQGALAFADGTFALARPIRENFAIITGKEGLAQVTMKVDPHRHGSSARSDWLSPAVVTDLSSYRLRALRVEPVDPPPGATPENTTFQLAPAYKSGVLLKVGEALSIVALGRLIDVLGAPLAHLPIEIRRSGHLGEPATETFTARNGNFQLAGVMPGKYEIHPSGVQWGTVTVTIPASNEGIHRLGDIVAPVSPP